MSQHASPFSPEEEAFRESVRNMANSGDLLSAMHFAREFHAKHPTSFIARYHRAVETGDYAEVADIPEDEKKAYKDFATSELMALRDDPNLPEVLKGSVANEVFWFTRQHEAQYNLGVERLQSGNLSGHYSMCVGASEMAKKFLLSENNVVSACEWAGKSLEAFRNFENYNSSWSNINHFAANSAAILGKYDESLRLYMDMFRKQGTAPDTSRVEQFKVRLAEIVQARGETFSTP